MTDAGVGRGATIMRKLAASVPVKVVILMAYASGKLLVDALIEIREKEARRIARFRFFLMRAAPFWALRTAGGATVYSLSSI
jgi:hypothetical protein